MSFKLLAHDLEAVLERLQEGTDFPYGEGDEALISQVNQTAKGLRLPEPIDAVITQSSVHLAVRCWGTGETVAAAERAQLIAMIIEGEPVFLHDTALADTGDIFIAPLRDWLRQARREQLVQQIKDETPVFPEPTEPLTPVEAEIRAILMEHASGRQTPAPVPGGELIMQLKRRGFGDVAADALSKRVKSLSSKGCPCGSKRHVGYWLIPTQREPDNAHFAATTCNKRQQTVGG